MGVRKDNSTPFLMVGMGSIQPNVTCDPTKSPGAGQLDTSVVTEYKVGRWRRGRDGMVCGLGREADPEGSEWWGTG